MRNNDGTPAEVDLQGAAPAIAVMYRLMEVLKVGDVSENTFWEARGILEKYEDALLAKEREECAKIAETTYASADIAPKIRARNPRKWQP